jgi:hypothetical protein
VKVKNWLKLPGYYYFQGVIVDKVKGAVLGQDYRRLADSEQEAITLGAGQGAETLYQRVDGILKTE